MILIWTNTIHIQDREQIRLFLEEIDQLDGDVRRLLCAAPLAIEASSHMIDQYWLSESGKPKEEQNWFGHLSLIDQLEKLPCVQEGECLRVSLARAKAVVYADYFKQTKRAIRNS